jgi:hypothetical protein
MNFPGVSAQSVVGDTSTASLPYNSWCAYSSVYLTDREEVFLSGGCPCDELDLYNSNSARLNYAALVDLNTWGSLTSSAVTDKPTATWRHAQVYYNGKVYCIAGMTAGHTGSTNVEIYDLETDTWSTGPAYPLALTELKCDMYLSTIFCAGGYGQTFKNNAYSIDLSAESPSWTTLPSLNTARTYAEIVYSNGHVYVIGGYGPGHYQYPLNVESLDVSNPTTWKTTSADIPEATMRAICLSANGNVYAISGVGNPRVVKHSYIWADDNDPLSSWTRVSVDSLMGTRECASGCDGWLNSMERLAYNSDVSGVTVLSSISSSSIEIRVIVPVPFCDASAAPTNGGVGDCTNSLASGSTCQPTCNAGYTVSGTSSCSAGILTAATCSVNPCDASAPPTNGDAGDCTNSLGSGLTCQPTCNSGYTVSGTSSCSEGTLTAATCIADTPTTCTMNQYLSAGACFACPSSTGDPVGTPAPSTSAGGSATYCTCPDDFRAQTGALSGEWTCNKCMDNAEKTGSVVPPPSGNNDVCECVANFFMDNTGLNCDACPTHSTSSVGFAACTCDDNYYAKLDGTWSCEACIGGNLKTGSVVPGTGDGETDADCTSTSCTANQYQVSGMCFACPIGSSSSGGAATECACPGNYSRSVDGITYSCSACAAGKVRAAVDTVPGGAATACDATICGTIERVQSNACAACPAGTTNAAGGHDASGGDTNCTTDVSPPAANTTNTTDMSPPAANTTNTTDVSPPAANITNTTDVSPPPPPPSPPPSPPPPNRLVFADYESSATRYPVLTALVMSIINLYITTNSV